MGIRPSRCQSAFALVEDTPERLVLQEREWNGFSMVALVCAAFWGSFTLATGAMVPLIVSSILLVLATLPLLRWRRLTFDAMSATVRVDRLRPAGWRRPLADIEDVQTDYYLAEPMVTRGATQQLRPATVYRLFLIAAGERLLVAESESSDFIAYVRNRILAMRGR